MLLTFCDTDPGVAPGPHFGKHFNHTLSVVLITLFMKIGLLLFSAKFKSQQTTALCSAPRNFSWAQPEWVLGRCSCTGQK